MSDRRLWMIPALASALGVPFVAMDGDMMQVARERIASMSQDSPGAGYDDLEYGAGGSPAYAYGEVDLPEARRWPTDVAGRFQHRRAVEEVALAPPAPPTMAPSLDAASRDPLPGMTLDPGAYAGPLRPGDGALPFDRMIRFDVTPDAVTSNWSRVTTTQSEHHLLGMRVAVVSGPEISDLAGSLTYYFDDSGQLQRISLQGYTGDASKLIAHCQQGYELQKQPSLDAGMYVALWNGMPTSVLHVARAPVIRAESPRTQYYVTLEINRPSSHMQLSPQASALVERTHQARRWSL